MVANETWKMKIASCVYGKWTISLYCNHSLRELQWDDSSGSNVQGVGSSHGWTSANNVTRHLNVFRRQFARSDERIRAGREQPTRDDHVHPSSTTSNSVIYSCLVDYADAVKDDVFNPIHSTDYDTPDHGLLWTRSFEMTGILDGTVSLCTISAWDRLFLWRGVCGRNKYKQLYLWMGWGTMWDVDTEWWVGDWRMNAWGLNKCFQLSIGLFVCFSLFMLHDSWNVLFVH